MNVRDTLRRFGRFTLRIVLLVLSVPALYVLAAVIGAILRPMEGPRPAEQLYRVVMVWSDIHTDIILPARGLSVDWTVTLAGAGTPETISDADYLAFGWGSESFYTNAPEMADISVGLLARALFFDTTVVHVSPVHDPAGIPAGYRRTFELSAERLMALERYVLESFALLPDGRAEVLREKTYGYGDAFFHAIGRYNPVQTCNQWTSDGLRLVGIPAGYWTPFSQSLTWIFGTDADGGIP